MKEMQNIKLIATDLDGTFLKNDSSVSNRNIETLLRLGEKDIVRVVATGRNLKKVKDVLNEHVPFDYIVFSSGAGVFDWNLKKHIHSQNIAQDSSKKLLNFLVERDYSFYAFYPAPENHKHWVYRGGKNCAEFERYFNFNKSFATEIIAGKLPDSELCQFLIIIREDAGKFEKLKNEIEEVCAGIRVIRASSPITAGYIWVEVFHRSVSKGSGVKFICDQLKIDYKHTLGIGNDYNDFDLLDFTEYSFLTENAPKEIIGKYKGAPSNENDAFAIVANRLKEI